MSAGSVGDLEEPGAHCVGGLAKLACFDLIKRQRAVDQPHDAVQVEQSATEPTACTCLIRAVAIGTFGPAQRLMAQKRAIDDLSRALMIED